jgi:DUF4097 and DUF4098 domain-containing protein YvlB
MRLNRCFYLVALIHMATPVSAEQLSETFDEVLPFAPGHSLELSNRNGGIEVNVWDQPDMRIVAHKRVQSSNWSDADLSSYLEDVIIDIEQQADSISVDTRIPNNWRSSVSISVEYKISVPANANLDLESSNGRIRVEGIDGELTLRTVNGQISAQDVSGNVTTQTTNGAIKVELHSLAEGSSTNLRTNNGSVKLTIPGNTAANINAKTSNGSVHSDIPLSSSSKTSRRRVSGEINGGGPTIDLRTVNGSIRIRAS